jgi:hypothetical protein
VLHNAQTQGSILCYQSCVTSLTSTFSYCSIFYLP